MTYEEAIRILHPNSALHTLAEFHEKDAARKAIDEACLLACEALSRDVDRPCAVYTDDVRYGKFKGFCDNNDKCVIEFENGELHKAYVWSVQFVDR